MSRLLVVDDKEMMRDSVATMLTRQGHSVVAAGSCPQALEKLTAKPFDCVITDLQMPDGDGLELLVGIRQHDEQLPVIFMTAYGTVDTAVTAMKQGAFDYLTKPFTGDELMVTVQRALEHGRLMRENLVLKAVVGTAVAADRGHPMIGDGATMRKLKSRLAMLADSHGTILVTGESGAGKEVAARWIHAHSPRADQPFLAINCAALSTSLLESELFGHEKGAFTGADRLRKGRFELADRGTLLLDEISEIDPTIQAKLLRVLQERCFDRVGSSTSRTVDVRVIATTNRDLNEEVARGTFRQDLYYRLNVLPVTVPPLRQLTEDLDELAQHFLQSVANREGKPVKIFEPHALELMRGYPWPGNVRELHNVCERAAVLTTQEIIPASLIEPWLGVPTPIASSPSRASSIVELRPNGAVAPCPGVICDGNLTLEDVEREAIIATLRHHHGHRQKSAAALGIGVRTLGLKLKKWKELQLVSPSL